MKEDDRLFQDTRFGYIVTPNGFYRSANMSGVTTLNRTGLADALFPQTRQKVLWVFLVFGERSFCFC